MRELQKKTFIFLFILFQSMLAVSGGFLMLYSVTKNNVPQNVSIGKINVGSLDKNQASKKLEDVLGKNLKSGFLIIKNKDISDFQIKLSDIDASFDFSDTFNNLEKIGKKEALLNLINSNFMMKKQEFSPSIKFNEEKLRDKLNELAVIINKEPSNANIYLKDDKVIKTEHVIGRKLNIDNAIKKIRDELGQDLNSPIEFKTSNNFEIETINPKITLNDLDGANEVISKYSTEVKSQEEEASIKLAVDAINKVLVFPLDIEHNEDAGVFSFNKYIKMENGIVENNNEGYNQVASTLYAAIVQAGIKPEGISRTPHKTTVDYIEPGLDTVVFGNTTDFSFKNTLDSTLVIFAELKDRNLTVSIVSKKKDSSVKKSLSIDIEQKIDPPVTYVENKDLAEGQKKVVTYGKNGVNVKVYLFDTKDGVQTEKKYLYDNQYDAEEAIVQIGPNTKWENSILNNK